jgi:hypothetical protein
MSSYLFYTSCFHQKQYVDIVVNMLNSYYDTGSSIDFLVYTTTEFRAAIEEKMPGKPIKFFEKNFVKTMNQARISKVDIFDYTEIANYEKIIYIDADTMFLRNPQPMFDSIVNDVVYASGEGNILCEANYWGRSLFLKADPNYVDQEGISVSCLGFKNIAEIKKIFAKIKQAFYLDMYQNKLTFYDQPFFNMVLITNNMVNKTEFKNYILSRPAPENATNLVAVHFAGCPGHAQIKLDLFAEFKSKFDELPKAKPVQDQEPITYTVETPKSVIDEANLLEFIRQSNPYYTFDNRSKRLNIESASKSSTTMCFLCGDTAIPSAIALNSNPSIQIAIVEHISNNNNQTINNQLEITNIETLISQARKFDTIVCDERDQIDKVIISALRLSKPASTIIINGIEDPHIAETWQKYVAMFGLIPGPFPDTETQSVKIIP